MKVPFLKPTTLFCMLLIASTALAQEATIGVVLPLTGGAASNGESIRNSILLADAKYDQEDRVKFIFEDDQLQPRLTVSAVKKLISRDKVDGLIVFGSPTSLAANSIAEASKVPMVGMSVVDRVVSGKEYVVKHWVTAERENKELVKEVKKRGYESIAVVSTTNDAMLKLRDLFIASGTTSILLDEEFLPSDTDFRAIITKIRALNPDAVYLLLWAPQPGVFAKQLRQAGYEGAIFGAHNLEDPDEVKSAAGALDGVWYVTGDDKAGSQFYKVYKDKFGQLPANGGINAYDIAKLMIEGSKSGDLNTYLHTVIDFTGAYGTYDATGANDFDIPATIKVITPEGFQFSNTSAD